MPPYGIDGKKRNQEQQIYATLLGHFAIKKSKEIGQKIECKWPQRKYDLILGFFFFRMGEMIISRYNLIKLKTNDVGV